MKTIADIAVEVLNRFGGFDHWWHDIDPADQREIKKALNKAIADKFPGIEPKK